MKKACLVVNQVYKNNEIFKSDSPLNRDNCLQFFHELKAQFKVQGIDLQTQDLCSLEEASVIIYNEMPKDLKAVKYPAKSAVMLFESELIRPDNWDLKNHQLFKHIFTWSDDFVDNRKYFKFNFTGPKPVEFLEFNKKPKFCTLVAGNKNVNHPLELYSKRVDVIRWFEKYNPDQFEFFGMGWEAHTFRLPLVSRVLNRIGPLRKMFSKKWPLYRGPVKNKLELLQKYKFSICFENASGIKGYITEKILDSLAAGCVPVYWGAPNITDFIPKECLILMSDFKTYDDLYAYLVNMSEVEYNQRLAAIKKFLMSPQHQAFEPAFIARIVVGRVLSND